jgi:hypothetical protein
MKNRIRELFGILIEAKGLLCWRAVLKQVLRFAQDDKIQLMG